MQRAPISSIIPFLIAWPMAILFMEVSRYPFFAAIAFPYGFEGPAIKAEAFFGFGVAGIGLMFVAICTLHMWRPLSAYRFLLTLTCFLAYCFYTAPNWANHRALAVFISLGFMWVYAHHAIRSRHIAIDIRTFYDDAAPIGRAALLVMYFFGVFHKLNSGFLDLGTSCASEFILYTPFIPQSWLQTDSVKYAAIYGTLIIETLVMVLLLTQQFRRFAIILGMGFHFLIGTMTLSILGHFSALAFALHMLFLPPNTMSHFRESRLLRHASDARVRTYGYSALIGFLLLISGVATYGYIINDIPFRGIRLLWWVYGGALFLFVIAFAHYDKQSHNAEVNRTPILSPVRLANISMLLLIIHSCSSYIGLKTNADLAMFSNLRTELGKSNHLIITKPPYLFDYQNHYYQVIPDDYHIYPEGTILPYINLFDLRRHISRTYAENGTPETLTLKAPEGQPRVINIATDMPELYEPLPWYLIKALAFTSLDLIEPRPCSSR